MIEGDKLTAYALQTVKKNYREAKSKEYISKPLAWALYQTWKYVDKHEKPRTGSSK